MRSNSVSIVGEVRAHVVLEHFGLSQHRTLRPAALKAAGRIWRKYQRFPYLVGAVPRSQAGARFPQRRGPDCRSEWSQRGSISYLVMGLEKLLRQDLMPPPGPAPGTYCLEGSRSVRLSYGGTEENLA